MDEIMSYARRFGLKKRHIEGCITKISNETNRSYHEVIRIILSSLEDISGNCVEPSSPEEKSLRPYQKIAVQHLITNRGLVVGFDTGTGKTFTAVSVMKCIIQLASYFGMYAQFIVIAPVSLIHNFKQEVERAGIAQDNVEYLTFEKFQKLFSSGKFSCEGKYLIVDEAHRLRTDFQGIFSDDSKGKVSKAATLCSKDTTGVLLLTATPMFNSDKDILNLVAMINGKDPDTMIRPHTLLKRSPPLFTQEYRNMFMFQHADETNYPSKTEIIRAIVMTKSVLLQHQHIERNIEGNENAYYALLRKTSNTIQPNYKLAELKKIIDEALSMKKRCIVYTNYLDAGVEQIRSVLPKNKTLVYTGEVDVDQRVKLTELYNTSTDGVVMILTSAGSLGLDLKETEVVVLYEQNWNIATNEQVVGRARRYMSHTSLPPERQKVNVYYLMLIKPHELSYEPVSKKISLKPPDFSSTVTEPETPKGISKSFFNREKALKTLAGSAKEDDIEVKYEDFYDRIEFVFPEGGNLNDSLRLADETLSGKVSSDLKLLTLSLKKYIKSRETSKALEEIQIGTSEKQKIKSYVNLFREEYKSKFNDFPNKLDYFAFVIKEEESKHGVIIDPQPRLVMRYLYYYFSPLDWKEKNLDRLLQTQDIKENDLYLGIYDAEFSSKVKDRLDEL